MINNEYKSMTENSIIIDAMASDIWPYFSSSDGWNRFLSDIALLANSKQEVSLGDEIILTIGELTNRATCVAYDKYRKIVFNEQYSSILPNGEVWSYALVTSFQLLVLDDKQTKVTVKVEGYEEDEMMQWIRECGEMGWRQSLLHLKTVIELGLDLRNDIFNYPRLGVLNYTATQEQLLGQGLDPEVLQGNYIKVVYPGGPAYTSGLIDGCILTKIGEFPVPNYRAFVEALGRYYAKDQAVELEYYVNKQRITTIAHLTYDDRFTGMIDPEATSLEDVRNNRLKQSSEH